MTVINRHSAPGPLTLESGGLFERLPQKLTAAPTTPTNTKPSLIHPNELRAFLLDNSRLNPHAKVLLKQNDPCIQAFVLNSDTTFNLITSLNTYAQLRLETAGPQGSTTG